MPATDIKGLSAGAGSFLKKNAKFAYGGGIGLAFLAADTKGILDADNKLKALLKTAKDFILIRVAMIGVFSAVSKAVKALVVDTGSLNEALKRLAQIQQYSRQFQTFTGGIGKAKERITELYNLSLRRPFKFEDIVEANKSLEIFTRGAYSSVEATKVIGRAAIGTGNNFQDTARAVGNFYEQLRAGKPIDAASEQLHEMGVITGATADELNVLASSGADIPVVFTELTKSLEAAGDGAAGYKDDLEAVTQAHENAMNELKRSFGAPWTESEVQNTKNMTAAIQAISPSVGKVSEAMAFLYNGFSAASSAIAKTVFQSKLFQKAFVAVGYAIGTLTVAAGLFGSMVAFTLLPVLFQFASVAQGYVSLAMVKLTGSITAAEYASVGLGVALRTLSVVTVVGGIITFITAMGGALYKLNQAIDAEKDAQKKLIKTRSEGNAAIAAEIAGITTLKDKHEALIKALENQMAAEKALAEYRKSHPDKYEKPQGGPFAFPMGTQTVLNPETEASLKGQANTAKILVDELSKLSSLDDEHLAALIKAEEEIKAENEDMRKGVEQRKQEAETGLQIAHQTAQKRSGLDDEIAKQTKVLDQSKAQVDEEIQAGVKKKKVLSDTENQYQQALKEGDRDRAISLKAIIDKTPKVPEAEEDHTAQYDEIAKKQEGINKLEKERLKMGLDVGNTPGGRETTTYLGARLQQLEAAKSAKITADTITELSKEPEINKEGIRKHKLDLSRYVALAMGAEAGPGELERTKAQLGVAERRQAELKELSPEARAVRVGRFQAETAIKGQQATRRGDVAGAQAAEDVSRLTGHMEQLLGAGFGAQEAGRLGLAQTQEEIAQQYVPASQITSPLAAVGGGGEVSQIDPELDSARRREAIQAEMLSVLKILAGQEPDQSNTPTFAQ